MPARRGIVIIPLLIVLTALIGIFGIYKITNLKQSLPKEQVQPPGAQTQNAASSLKEYSSKDLKISFNYPKNWYVDEKDYDIMLTSYKTKIGENKQPNADEIKIFIDNFNGCHDTLDENLIDPACGEGGTAVAKNKIISKESRSTPGGTFYKYLVQTPNQQFTYYLLEKGDRILDIEKHPDPSQYEKEFDELVNSIRFL
ncbi:MAG: PsbP-related protein [Candidatus Curtissbacteria bacterium]